MRKIIALLLIAIATSSVANAQIGKAAAMKGKVEDGYDFWLYAPQQYFEQQDREFPVIIYLHGRGLCGRGLRHTDKYYTLEAIAMGREINSMVIAPQNPGGAWSPDRLNNILDWVLDNYRACPDSVYVIGMSLGGYGTMDFVGKFPEKIAAAMALCGGTTLKDVQGMGKLPFWILHGTADRAVNISESKKVVQALQAQHNDKLLRYDWLPGANHGRLARICYMKQTYEWLFAHSRATKPQVVNRDIIIDLDAMTGTYKGLRTRNKSAIPIVDDIK